MPFIGVVCDTKYEKDIKPILTKNLEDKTVIFLKEESIENLKNIKFETILIFLNHEKILSKTEIIKNIIQKAKYLIINADEPINLNLLENINAHVITYGFNSKSTITASSVKEDNILLCIQRTIQDIYQNEIEQQEISIQKENSKMSSNVLMGVATLLLLYGIKEISW